ncbi:MULTISPECIES: hydratase [Anaerotruncus]|uniref:Hydratase n=1 Tax=Anaerotruncus colihominis TaxID=169435 RepID=A0A845T0W7_9FIRM|nr:MULTISPECIES: hydratase [Anaerotruncus]MCI8491572.1 hydratase [Anaerotruncus sp.]MCR2025302.1 hydratase [Anaerotruncus colihominis]NDO40403.1 hydratase [Anaerotruncus colihominis]
MIKLYETGAYYAGGKLIPDDENAAGALAARGLTADREAGAKNTIAWSILEAHNTSGNMDELKIKFDAMASHDITYVGIVQTARASGLERFPLPYVLTNCHNSLCAVGGTINEDDHMFGLSAAKKYGGIYVPAHQAVIHQYMREMMSGCGKMILGSDSHTRYGALGTMAVGEGGPELVKQLLNRTYDIRRPQVVAVYLTGRPHPGVGPQDVALAIIGAVFKRGYVKNKVMEFIGDGIANLGVEYRSGIDVMTTETTCLSSIWETDGQISDYFALHGRPEAYKQLAPKDGAYYDGVVYVDLSTVKPMIAMPFHPSNAYEIDELNANLMDILAQVEADGARALDNPGLKFTLRDKVKDGRLIVDQGVIAGCAGGTYDNICDAADILAGHSIGVDEFALSVYPSSQPVYISLVENGAAAKLMQAGATMRTAFCGPCFGAGDVPANGGLSIRHSTRNFPNREGSKPGNGQIASVALMDARSIAATARNGGVLTPATDLDTTFTKPTYLFHGEVYKNRVYDGWGKPEPELPLKFGPNIADWPEMPPLTEHLFLEADAYITDPVTTTDELIPSGETSSYRSNPLKLAEFTLSRKDPAYVERAKASQKREKMRLEKGASFDDNDPSCPIHVIRSIEGFANVDNGSIGRGSLVYAVKPGDGSAREQAASCQKVLGGWANIAREYATKRYRSNLINWGMLPFLIDGEPPFEKYDSIFIPHIRSAVAEKRASITAYALTKDGVRPFELTLGDLTDDERAIILAGCLINYYRAQK